MSPDPDKERIRHRLLKADLIKRGLCRQCGKRRGKSPSASRCVRCLKRARAASQEATQSQPYQSGKPGRPPMDVRRKRKKKAEE